MRRTIKITGLPPVSDDKETAGRQLRCIFWLCEESRMKFKVLFYQDGEYEVFEFLETEQWSSVFIGRLADCEAYIRLRENNQVDF